MYNFFRGVNMQKNKTRKEIVNILLKQEITKAEEDELLDLLVDKPIAVDVEKQEESNLTFGEKLADKFSAIAGSWTFILLFALFLTFWIILNTIILKNNAIDPYPFILLNLLLSCLAAFQAPIIMMSQNRQSKKDSLRNQNDYYTDVKSELIIEELHNKIDGILKNQREIQKYIDKEKKDEL